MVAPPVNIPQFIKQKLRANAEPVAGIYGQVTSTVRSGNEIFEPISHNARLFGKGLIPFRGLSVILSTPFEVKHIIDGTQTLIKAPGKCKVFPAVQIGVSTGVIIDNAVATIGIFENIGLLAAKYAALIGIPLGLVAVALQTLGIGLSSWVLHKIDKIEKKVDRAIRENPGLENYREALNYLVNEPGLEHKQKKFKRDFLGLLNQEQKAKIKEILNKSGEDIQVLEKTTALLKNHIFHRKVKEALSIAISIISIVGVVILIFSPVPFAPVGWGILTLVGIGSLGTMAYVYAYNRKLNKSLLKIFPQGQQPMQLDSLPPK